MCSSDDDERFLQGYQWVFHSISDFDDDAFRNVCERARVSGDALIERVRRQNPEIDQRYSRLIETNPARKASQP